MILDTDMLLQNNSERPVDALAEKDELLTHLLTTWNQEMLAHLKRDSHIVGTPNKQYVELGLAQKEFAVQGRYYHDWWHNQEQLTKPKSKIKQSICCSMLKEHWPQLILGSDWVSTHTRGLETILRQPNQHTRWLSAQHETVWIRGAPYPRLRLLW